MSCHGDIEVTISISITHHSILGNIEEGQTDKHSEATRFGCHLQLQIGRKCVNSKFSETQTHPCSSNGVFHQCNFTSTHSATRIQNQGRSPKSSYWSKNKRIRNLREAICCIKQLWECLFLTTQKFKRFVQSNVFESRSYDGNS